MISVEVAYALAERQTVIAVQVPEGTTALQAVHTSGILQRHPDIDAQRLDLGVFGKAVAHGQPLKSGDRVEIYRPLRRDPVDARRRRAQQGR